MKNVRQLEVDDPFVQEIVPMMVYNRQRPQIDYLLELTVSDMKNCHAEIF